MSGFDSRRSVRFLEVFQTGGSECDPRYGWHGIWRYRGGRLSCVETAELLGISERHFRRLRDRYEAEGPEGLIDRRRGRASGRRAPVN
jgi:Winged helix-turn helix